MPEQQLYVYNDYAQSANSLFHFVGGASRLNDILERKALVPRYCIEDTRYLRLENGEESFPRVAVLQKCFCDIPLYRLMSRIRVQLAEGEEKKLTTEERIEIESRTTHPDLYGKFGIAFSKEWGEKKQLLPVHYVNEKSEYINNYSKLFCLALQQEDLAEDSVFDILGRLAYLKPLRGEMIRKIGGESRKKITILKNFHDEREWRYVPSIDALKSVKLMPAIANNKILKIDFFLDELNNKQLPTERYRAIWISYDYDDIRYLIVPDTGERINLIKTILALPDNLFNGTNDVVMSKNVLISKIIVLDELGEDL